MVKYVSLTIFDSLKRALGAFVNLTNLKYVNLTYEMSEYYLASVYGFQFDLVLYITILLELVLTSGKEEPSEVLHITSEVLHCTL